MKNLLIALSMVICVLAGWHLGASQQEGVDFLEMHSLSDSPVTVSMRQNDFELCGQPFYDDVYALTVEDFAKGADQVVLADYSERIFDLVRASVEYGSNADAFIEHIADIPRQLIEIIDEDPAVLDSCENFSVALVGPP